MTQLFYGNLTILSVAIFGLALGAARFLEHKWLALLTVCPGWMWFVVAVSAPGYLSNWSFLNGMETAVELFFLAGFLLCYRPGAYLPRWLPAAIALLGVMVLCRLDDVFFLFPVLGFLVATAPRASRRTALALSAIPFAMLAVYLLYNLHTVGRAMPVSGDAKAGFVLRDNFTMLYDVFAPVDWAGASNKASIGFSVYAERYVRVLQMGFPMLVGALYLARWRRKAWGLVDALCVGVLLKGAYNFCFVTLFAQGYWYYGASLFVANLILSLALDHALVAALGRAGAPRVWRYGAVAGEVPLVLFSMNAFITDKLDAAPGAQMQAMVEQRKMLAQMVLDAGGHSFIEFDDGILGFATDMGSLSGFGLVSDPEARTARKHGHFFDLAVQRGDSLVLSNGGYANQLEGFSRHAQAGGGGDFDGIESSEFREYALVQLGKTGPADVRLYRLVHR